MIISIDAGNAFNKNPVSVPNKNSQQVKIQGTSSN